MISLSLLLAFIATAALLAVTPGLDTAIVLRTLTVAGRRQAVLAALGIGLGCLLWGVAVSLGLGALLQASETAYLLLRIAGAAYLVWLGIRLLLRPRTALDADSAGEHLHDGREAFIRGLLVNLLNPKVGVFYVTFLPQFVPSGASVAGYSLFLASLHVALTLLWFALLILVAAPLGRWLRRPAVVRWLDRASGGVFTAFGIRLAVSSGP